MRPKRKKYPVFFVKTVSYSLVALLIGIFLLPKTAFLSSITAERIIELTNRERIGAGAETLAPNPLLAQAAYNKGLDILAAQEFGHNLGDRGFSAWIKEAGYKYSYAGENLAMDFVTGEGAIKAWLTSPTHRKNLLSPDFREIGVSVLEGKFEGTETTLIVQIFASPLVAIAPLTGAPQIISVSPAIETEQTLENRPYPADIKKESGGYASLAIDKMRGIKLWNHGWPLSAAVQVALAAAFFAIVSRLRNSYYLRYLFTAKNKQLKLPLK